MSPRLQALRHDRIDASRFEPARFIYRCGWRKNHALPLPDTIEQLLRRQSEVKAHNRGTVLRQYVSSVVIERCTRGSGCRPRGIDLELAIVRRQHVAPPSFA